MLLVPLGLATYCLYVYTLTGNPLAWLEANRHWDYTLGHAPGQRLLEFVSTLWRSPYNVLVNPAELYQLFHATTGVLFLTSTPWVFTRVGVPFGAYVLATLLIPLTGSQLEGIGRYSANLFPVFMLLATFRSPRVYDALLVVFSLLLALFVGLFVNWHPIYWESFPRSVFANLTAPRRCMPKLPSALQLRDRHTVVKSALIAKTVPESRT